MPVMDGMNRAKDKAFAQTGINQALSRLGTEDFNVENRFDDYKPQFDFGSMRNSLDDLYDRYSKYLGRSTQNKIADNRQSTSARMASEGISGGSFVTDAINKGENQINQGYFDAMGKMNADKAGQNVDLMKYSNDADFRKNLYAQRGDQMNVQNLLRALGMQMGGYENLYNRRMMEEQQPGALEDFLGIGNTVAGFL